MKKLNKYKVLKFFAYNCFYIRINLNMFGFQPLLYSVTITSILNIVEILITIMIINEDLKTQTIFI